MPRKRPLSTLEEAAAGLQDATSAQTIAARWLSRRDYSSAQLAQRLSQRGFDAETVQSVLTQLIEGRYVDDARYGRAFVAVHAGRGQGPQRIRHELIAAGVTPALAEEALEEYAAEQGGWTALARRVRSRRFGTTAPRDRAESARQARFLHYRGFSTDHIRGALGDEAMDGAESS